MSVHKLVHPLFTNWCWKKTSVHKLVQRHGLRKFHAVLLLVYLTPMILIIELIQIRTFTNISIFVQFANRNIHWIRLNKNKSLLFNFFTFTKFFLDKKRGYSVVAQWYFPMSLFCRLIFFNCLSLLSILD